MSKPPWQLTASEALPLLQSGDLKALDYAKSLLERIHKRDMNVKAWVYMSPPLVLREAERLDDIPVAARGPLHGLPVAIKDIALTKDMPTQYNSKLYTSEDPVRADANAVITLRQAGALIFGKTTTTEFATSKQGDYHQNHTVNPHDFSRTPGGSSSGSGAAVGDFQVPVALGTQTGGSIIRPASFNGCYGLKPTWGAISREGLGQWCPTLDTCGFLTRSVDDLDILLETYKVQDDEQVTVTPFALSGSTFAFCKTHNWPNAGPGTRNAMQKAAEILKSHGATVEDVDMPEDFSRVLEWHAAILTGEGRASFLGQYLTDKSLMHADIVGHVDNKKGISRKQQVEAYDNLARLRSTFDEIARKYHAVITPSVVDEAPADVGNTGDMSFCSPWTALHTPALNIPGFEGENKMPVGLTLLAPRFRDRHLLHVAKTVGPIFEEEGGWRRKNADPEPVMPNRRRMSSGYRSR